MSTETAAALDEPPVLFERVGRHVAVVTLNRPAARNAVNGALAQLLGGYVRSFDG